MGVYVNSMSAHPYCIKKEADLCKELSCRFAQNKNTGKAHSLQMAAVFTAFAAVYILIIFVDVLMGVDWSLHLRTVMCDKVWGSEWVGLKNFEKFFKSVKFPVVMRNTLTISLYSLVVTFPIPIIFVLFLKCKCRDVVIRK